MKKILVVDDDRGVRLSFCEVLKGEGFLPIEASNGKEAIELFKKETPLAVLLDLKMPGMDGLEVLQELKKIDPDIPIIIVTAFSDIETAVICIKIGAYGKGFSSLCCVLEKQQQPYREPI
ncbi:sporulation initiation phosphotransferase F [Dissulfurispira thermophila]|uniref:Sporulation initiation phosphotransferase F n=1 Tax=Dissulfurispira thermophila TaxID=2715679 RepID=A0A7G1GZ23_9BACT|nr:response regulator [Dissulfurispira thermophila]BCB95322.1 sporulation initiation phosphotransferase F [Dissulfurispira thermophila]